MNIIEFIPKNKSFQIIETDLNVYYKRSQISFFASRDRGFFWWKIRFSNSLLYFTSKTGKISVWFSFDWKVEGRSYTSRLFFRLFHLLEPFKCLRLDSTFASFDFPDNLLELLDRLVPPNFEWAGLERELRRIKGLSLFLLDGFSFLEDTDWDLLRCREDGDLALSFLSNFPSPWEDRLPLTELLLFLRCSNIRLIDLLKLILLFSEVVLCDCFVFVMSPLEFVFLRDFPLEDLARFFEEPVEWIIDCLCFTAGILKLSSLIPENWLS